MARDASRERVKEVDECVGFVGWGGGVMRCGRGVREMTEDARARRAETDARTIRARRRRR